MARVMIILLYLAVIAGARGASEIPPDVPVLTPEELENYEFPEQNEEPPVVEDLSVGQRFILDAQRREMKDLIARRLGVMELEGNENDLPILQQLIDRDVLEDDQVKEWQALGVIFGDILVEELNLHWVSYEDERGVSKALQWRDTMNFVFPVTAFSRRVQFNQEIDVREIYEKIRRDVAKFREPRPGSRVMQ